MLRKDLPSFSEPFFTHLARSLKGVAMCIKKRRKNILPIAELAEKLQKSSYIKSKHMKVDEI
jgi:hypothetical protein